MNCLFNNTIKSAKSKNWLMTIAMFALTSLASIGTINAQVDCNVTLACNNLIQVSLDADNCQQVITPDMILEAPPYADSYFTVVVKTATGAIVPNATVTYAHIGQTLTASVSLNGCGLSCWGSFTVEDKLAPVFASCPSITVDCGDDITPAIIGYPSVDDNCSGVTTTYSDVTTVLPCANAFSKRVDRTWVAKDAVGNKSTCVQSIYFNKANIAFITFPENYDDIENPVFECGNTAITLLPNGAPSPTVTGFPIGIDCPNVQYFYNDILFDLCGNSIKVLRQWTVIDWCTGLEATDNQIIKIMDKTPPVCPSSNTVLTINTATNACTGTYPVPAPTVSDCSGYTYTVSHKVKVGNASPYTNLSTTGVTGSSTTGYTITGLIQDTSYIVYTITDDCNNTTQCYKVVSVKDQEAPTAICGGYTVISIDGQGSGELFATSLNDNSLDNCGIAKYEIRKQVNSCGNPSDLVFGESVGFCCSDVNATNPYVKVELKVTDYAGNTNICVANVKVQDKTAPTLTCPAAVTIDCGQDYNNITLTGNATGTDNCTATVTKTDTPTLNSCGLGTIKRIWKVTDSQGTSATCQQIITIQDLTPFGASNITWPLATISINACDIAVATPELLNSKPSVSNDQCADIAMSYTDEVFPGSATVDFCKKINRKWKVVNWCASTTNPVFYEFQQTIILTNSAGPVIASGCGNRVIESTEGDCQQYAEHAIIAHDDCTPDAALKYTWAIDLYNDGTTDFSGAANNTSGTYPGGTHKMTFTVKDACGNVSTCSYTFRIKDNKPPTPICIGKVIWVLDADGNAVVWASDFNLKSEDFCDGSDLKYSFNAAGTQTSKSFTCADVPNGIAALIPLRMYAIDSDGNYEFCDVVLELQDSQNTNACQNTSNATARIAGNVYSTDNEGIENLDVKLAGNAQETLTQKTNETGLYTFDTVQLLESYVVNPKKNDDVANGITTLDLVLIQKHILGSKKLTNPYLLLAADINKSQTITAQDLIALRKVILGVENAFPNNDSWRFIPTSHVFADSLNPFSVLDQIEIQNFMVDEMHADFYAIKVGDLNKSAINNLNGNTTDNRSTVEIVAANKMVKAGQKVEVPVYLSRSMDLMGLQMAFQVTNCADYAVKPSQVKLTAENSAKVQQELRLSYQSTTSQTIADEMAMFTLEITPQKDGMLSDFIALSHEYTTEIFGEDLHASTLRLEWSGDANASATSVVLSPNPFAEQTTLTYHATNKEVFAFKIVDTNGRLVVEKPYVAQEGVNTITINKSELSLKNGIYFYELSSNTQSHVGKFMTISE